MSTPGAATDHEAAGLLARVRRVAVLGVSDRFTRPSFRLAAYLLDRTAWQVDLVNPHVDETLNRMVVPSLAALPTAPELVVVFRSPSVLDAVVDEAAAAGVGALWFPAGVQDGDPGDQQSRGAGPATAAGPAPVSRAAAVDHAVARARAAGLEVVAGRDLKRDHQRWCR